ncbi:ubiquinol-cytochrome c reductase cytochrome b subunit [Intrasporangium sp.]|uniref:cytochrome bc1 complex cytochrome b subunit n=1 Tax=Intrasporangium sp. TaxID=1925024 RepID=UPI003221F6C3
MGTSSIPKDAAGLRADDPAPRAPTSGPATTLGGVAGWFDDRTGGAKGVRHLVQKVFPDHWSFMLGEIAMYSLIILLVTGTFLSFWFVPSMNEVIYHGSYAPLQDIQMSEAYRSTLHISFDIRGGLLIRQIHHWSALLFLVSITVHMFRVFFTGAFRKPREINWVIGVSLAFMATMEGFAGYSLPDDLLSGTGLRVAEGFMQSIPVIGSYVPFLLFGGPFPGEDIVPRLYMIHILLLPALIVGLFTAHILLVFIHKHTQYPGPGRTEHNVVGYPFMPVYTAKAGGFFFIVFGVTALLAALVTINPIWSYGPYSPTQISAGSQPDWYMFFADGALRLMPPLEFAVWGITLSINPLLPGILLLGILFTIAGVYPFLERHVTGDHREHHLLDRPRNAPTRTGLGAMAITFYALLMLGSSNDIIADKVQLSINDITNLLRCLVIVGPPIAFWVTKRVCLSLQRRDRELVLHGRETGRIVRTAEGRFFEAHEPLDEYSRWPLVQHEVQQPIALDGPVDSNGVHRPGGAKEKVRARLSHFYFSDRIEAVTPAELAAVHHDGAPPAIDDAGQPTRHALAGATADSHDHRHTDRS